jgi:RHS repeat-associated protein
LYGLNVDAVMAQDSSTGMLWSLADRLGSIDLLTDEDGIVVNKRTFDSFGQVLSQTNPSVSFRYGYTGRELDLESGLHYYRVRYYDSNVGRFISVDPIGFEAGDTNLYRYVSNNATNANDPTGLWLNFAIGAALGGGIDLAVQLWEQKGDLSKIDPTRLAISTISGAIGGGIGGALTKGGFLVKGTALADKGLGLGARTAINAGVGFNLGYWGKVAENGIKGQDLTEGALFTGVAGGAGGALGELIPVGTSNLAKGTINNLVDSKFWNNYGGQILQSIDGISKYSSQVLQNIDNSARTIVKNIKNAPENLPIFLSNRVTDARIILNPKIRFSDRINTADTEILNTLRQETADLVSRNNQINPDNKLLQFRKGSRKKILDDETSLAQAIINIEGNPVVQTRSFSGQKNFADNLLQENPLATQYAPFNSDPAFKAYKPAVNDFTERVSDTEFKILNQIYSATQDTPNATGTVKFIGNRETCYSCQKVALEFMKACPNIKLEFVYTATERNRFKLFYNRVRNYGSNLRWNG